MEERCAAMLLLLLELRGQGSCNKYLIFLLVADVFCLSVVLRMATLRPKLINMQKESM
jgi:hypothetical protein